MSTNQTWQNRGLGDTSGQALNGAKGDGVTDVTQKIQYMLDNLQDGDELIIPNGTYKLSAPLKLNGKNNITIVGESSPYWNGTTLVGGVIFSGFGFIVGNYNPAGNVKNVTVKNIGVICPDQANGFETQGNVDGCEFENCKTLSRDHGILCQSYSGISKNIRVVNCKTYNSIHGFIFKCQEVHIENCVATGHTTNGFGFISDNIVGAASTANCRWVTAVGCEAVSCTNGFNLYSRDMFSTNNANNLRCSDISLHGCKAVNCSVGYRLGDYLSTPGGNTYNDVFNIFLLGCSESGSTTNSIVLGHSDDSTIQMYVETVMYRSGYEKNVRLDLEGFYDTDSIKFRNLVSDGSALDLYLAQSFDVQIGANTTNKISVTNNLPVPLTILIRPTTSGTFSFGGFEPTQFVTPTGLSTSIAFGNALVTNWVYVTGLGKWICTTYMTVNIQ